MTLAEPAVAAATQRQSTLVTWTSSRDTRIATPPDCFIPGNGNLAERDALSQRFTPMYLCKAVTHEVEEDHPGQQGRLPRPRRSRGRPGSKQGAVGREAIVASARQLLDKLPPHKATNSSIARSAGVDPALVRYYFGSREELLLAVIEDILATWKFTHPPPAEGPAAKLAGFVRDMTGFRAECALDAAADDRRMRQLQIEPRFDAGSGS